MKICQTCKLPKEATEFYLRKDSVDGLRENCKECHRKRSYLSQTKTSKRKGHLEYNYGVTIPEYKKLYLEQEGKCKICELKFDVLCVDHCHLTYVVRGLICRKCNTLLANANDNIQILESAVKYLRMAPKQTVERLLSLLPKR